MMTTTNNGAAEMTATETPIDRHDFTKAARTLLNLAVELDIIDAVELGCMMAKHGADTLAIVEEISEAAFADRHDPAGRERSKKWHGLRDDTFRALVKA